MNVPFTRFTSANLADATVPQAVVCGSTNIAWIIHIHKVLNVCPVLELQQLTITFKAVRFLQGHNHGQ